MVYTDLDSTKRGDNSFDPKVHQVDAYTDEILAQAEGSLSSAYSRGRLYTHDPDQNIRSGAKPGYFVTADVKAAEPVIEETADVEPTKMGDLTSRKIDEYFRRFDELVEKKGGIEEFMRLYRRSATFQAFFGRLVSKVSADFLEEENEHCLTEQQKRMKDASSLIVKCLAGAASISGVFIPKGGDLISKGLSTALESSGQYVETLNNAGTLPFQARSGVIQGALQTDRESKTRLQGEVDRAKGGADEDEKNNTQAKQGLLR